MRLAWLAVLASLGVAAHRAPGAPAPLPLSAGGPRIVVAFTNAPQGTPAPAGTTGTRYGGDAYRLAQGAQRQAQRIGTAYALRELTSWPIEALAMHCVVYEVPDNRDVAQLIARLQKDARVLLAEPLQEFHTLTTPDAAAYNDPLYDLQSNLTTLAVAAAQQHAQGAGITVALIDTAVDAAHPDLRGRIVRSHSYLPPQAPSGSRHGTAMAGLIAAVANNHLGIVGIAPQAQVEVFAACWQVAAQADAAACNTFTLAQALAAALTSGAPIVNLSLAGPQDPLLAALIQQGLKRGVTFVGALAAGAATFPTSIPGVIAAAGSEAAATPGTLRAPAEHVMTLRPAAEYDFVSGTSVAAAEISGVIALLMSASRTHLSPAAVQALLGPQGDDAAHVVDASAALARLESQTRTRLSMRATP
jgi:subtilisin family serine protease